MMRNIPFPFLIEETLQSIVERQQNVRRTCSTVRLSRSAIEKNWREIDEHKWFLSERLGRDVGPEVAGLDYLENISRIPDRSEERRRPGVSARLRTAARRTLEFGAEFANSEGMKNFANMQRILRGVPNQPGFYELPPGRGVQIPIALRSLRISADLIRQNGSDIEEHKWLLSERLGRDVGSKAAAADYLRNINKVQNRGFLDRVRAVLESITNANGPNSIANLERALGAKSYTNR